MFDEEKVLILDKNKSDVTNKIIKVEKNIYFVKYKKEGKIYEYNLNSLFFLNNPTPLESCVIRTPKQSLTNISKSLDFGEYIKVFFQSGTNKTYTKNELVIEKDILNIPQNQAIFDYLKEMANTLTMDDIISDESEIKKDKNFLKKIYEKITCINENSVLKSYLSGEKTINLNQENNFLYPFSFNLSQKEAIENAFNNSISVIEGPPGTGKTQTILNIIGNAILDNKTVAVLSNNNSATDNIFEKLEKEGLSSISAKLGKEKNRKSFIENQKNLKKYPKSWHLKDEEIVSILKFIVSMDNKVTSYLSEKNIIAQLEEELEQLKIEQKYFLNKQTTSSFNIIGIPEFNADKLHDYFLYLNKQENKKEHFNKRVQIFSQFKYRFRDSQLYKNSIVDILDSIKYNFYIKKINELETLKKEKEDNIINLDLEKSFKQYTKLSMKVFKSFVYDNYNNKKIYNTLSDINQTTEFVKDYPVILSTTYSLLNCVSPNFMFDYMIIDESSQVDLVSAFPSMSLAKNIIIVGDSKQLPNIIDDKKKNEFNTIFEKYNIDNKYNYTINSLLGLTKNLYNDMPIKILREHYRCHPKIIGFCNKRFYDNQLIILSDNKNNNPIKQYKCVKGNHARVDESGSQFNDRQAQVIINELIPNENIDIKNDSIGIITPYKAQKNYLKKEINCKNVSIDTVHGFQGREKDTIIFSTVANNITKFLDNSNSINVAVSRAIDKLFLVTPYEYKSKDNSNISSLINYIKYNNFEIIESKINSIYDLLYDVNKTKRIEFLSKVLPYSKYASETITYHTIIDILKDEKYQVYEVKKQHYPLREISNEREILTEEENNFLNTNSHVDFIIFNKFDNLPVLVIECDGYKFHARKEQKIRDQKKNNILKKWNIPLLRLKTNECREKERIQDKLNQIIEKSVE